MDVTRPLGEVPEGRRPRVCVDWSHTDRFLSCRFFFQTSLALLCVLSAGEVETALSRTPVSLSRSRLAKQDLIELLFPTQLPTYLPCISAFQPRIALGKTSQTWKYEKITLKFGRKILFILLLCLIKEKQVSEKQAMAVTKTSSL